MENDEDDGCVGIFGSSGSFVLAETRLRDGARSFVNDDAIVLRVDFRNEIVVRPFLEELAVPFLSHNELYSESSVR